MADRADLPRWPAFVLRHRHPGNLAVHAASAVLFWVFPWIALTTGNPGWWIGFLVSGVVGAAGHYVFGDGGVSLREATSQPEVPWYVLRMFWRIARGRYGEDIAAAEALRAGAEAALVERTGDTSPG